MSVRAFILLFGCLAGILAQARIVYVVEGGTGAKGGTAWTNAHSSVAEAYGNAATGATSEQPNEVWIRYGAYACKDVSLKPNVVVRGGFVGTETLAAQADPIANPTILHDSNFKISETWNNAAKSTMWTTSNGRYIFHEPPTTGDATEYKGNGSVSDTTAFTFGDDYDIGPTTFHGLVFTKYGRSAIRMSKPSTSALVLRQCRFLNIGWTDNDYHVIHHTDMALDAEDCDFIGAKSAVFLTTSKSSCTAIFRRCRFLSTNSRSSRCGGIYATQNTQVSLYDCTFDRNLPNAMPGALYVNTAGDLTIEDCVFTRGRCNSANYGGAICYNPTKTATLKIRRSRFEKCVCTVGAASGKSVASALAVWGATGTTVTGNVENVAFIGNTYDISTSYPAASCVAFCANTTVNYAFNFINCLFENNRAAYTSASSALYTTVGSSTTVAPCATFAHCVFKNNVCGYKSGSSTEFGTTAGDKPRFTFVNTVFDNDAIQPSWRTDKPFSFANCATKSTSTFGTTATGCFRLGTLANNATIALEDATETNDLVVARRLSANSPYRRKSCSVWQATDGGLYLYDATDAEKPWLACWTSSAGLVRLTSDEAENLGLSTENAPLPDAFGASRTDHVGMGNLNAHLVRGLRVGIRQGAHD